MSKDDIAVFMKIFTVTTLNALIFPPSVKSRDSSCQSLLLISEEKVKRWKIICFYCEILIFLFCGLEVMLKEIHQQSFNFSSFYFYVVVKANFRSIWKAHLLFLLKKKKSGVSRRFCFFREFTMKIMALRLLRLSKDY